MSGLPSLQVPAGPIFCGATWILGSQYVFSGPLAGEAQAGFDAIAEVDPAFQASIDEAANVWELVYNNMIEFISPAPWGGELSTAAANETVALHTGIVAPDARLTNSSGARHATPPSRTGASMWSSSSDIKGLPLSRRQRFAYKPGPQGGAVEDVGGVPSVSVSREVVSSGEFAEVLKATADLCASGDNAGCSRHELYHDITVSAAPSFSSSNRARIGQSAAIWLLSCLRNSQHVYLTLC
eukprot:SAG11_NODE_390_length_9860_cov_49.246184_9_plen_240_part_00